MGCHRRTVLRLVALVLALVLVLVLVGWVGAVTQVAAAVLVLGLVQVERVAWATPILVS